MKSELFFFFIRTGTPNTNICHALQPNPKRTGNVQRSGYAQQPSRAYERAALLERKSCTKNGRRAKPIACDDHKSEIDDDKESDSKHPTR